MRIKHILFVLCLPLLLVASTSLQEQYQNHFSCSPTPSWVSKVSFSLDPETRPSQINEQNLLIDKQCHLEEKSNFFHGAIKILTPSGVDGLSQLRFHFDPAYEHLEMHTIQIYRDGQWSDRLNSSTYKILQRENKLDHNLYSGELSLVYFLDDVRVGDIVEYSCSIIGENPAFSPHYARVFYLQEKNAIEKIHCRVVGHPSQELYIKHFNTNIEPNINVISSDTKEWVWETCFTPHYLEEDDEPYWHNPLARIHLTQYKDWHEVAHKMTPLYALSDDLLSSCPSGVINLIDSWREVSDDPIEQATLALRFVQDEIRYQGFEDGVGGVKPTNPWTVFERRFGDCKDKTVLLQTLLKLMDIDSKPVLVHSKNGKNLAISLPSHLLFDHVILKISIDGETYWVDSTMNLQGGSLVDNHFPNYHWGLCISEDTQSLTQLPPEVLKKPVEIITSVTAKTPDIVEISTLTTRSGEKADNFRRYVGDVGLKEISADNLQNLKRKYGAVSALTPMSISDDRKNNILITMESYSIPTKTRSGKKIFKNRSSVLANYLDDGITVDRSAPYAISCPVWVKEHIIITNPYTNWTPETDEYNIEIPQFHYFYSSSFQGNTAEIHHEIKHIEDHIPIELINDYWNAVDEIKSRSIDEINIYIPE